MGRFRHEKYLLCLESMSVAGAEFFKGIEEDKLGTVF